MRSRTDVGDVTGSYRHQRIELSTSTGEATMKHARRSRPSARRSLSGRRLRALAAVGVVAMTTWPAAVGADTGSAGLKLVSGADPLPNAAQPKHCGSAAGVGPNDRHDWEQNV